MQTSRRAPRVRFSTGTSLEKFLWLSQPAFFLITGAHCLHTMRMGGGGDCACRSDGRPKVGCILSVQQPRGSCCHPCKRRLREPQTTNGHRELDRALSARPIGTPVAPLLAVWRRAPAYSTRSRARPGLGCKGTEGRCSSSWKSKSTRRMATQRTARTGRELPAIRNSVAIGCLLNNAG